MRRNAKQQETTNCAKMREKRKKHQFQQKLKNKKHKKHQRRLLGLDSARDKRNKIEEKIKRNFHLQCHQQTYLNNKRSLNVLRHHLS